MCCGTKRLTEINCPATCIYLESAHKHPAAVVRRQTEHDLHGAHDRARPRVRAAAAIVLPDPDVHRALCAGDGLGRVVDADVAEAAGALAAGFETASRGVVYEPQAASPVGEALRRELKDMLNRVGRGGGTRFEREAAEVLRGIERGAKHEPSAIGSGPVDYLTLVARILQERPPAAAAASTLILP